MMMVRQLLKRSLAVLFWLFLLGTFVSGAFVWFMQRQKRMINIAAWAGTFDLLYISQFEKETGIKVNISYYESNEELLLKLGTTGRGYDLIVPSDYAVYQLRQQNMLKKLDKTKLAFFSHLNPLLMGRYFDENNEYSVPFEWAVMGLGINNNCYPDGIKDYSWGLIFDKKYAKDKRILMTNDPLVGVFIASLYLFDKRMSELLKSEYATIQNLLERQHPWVSAYTDMRAHYALASMNGCIALASSSYILKSMREYDHINFVIPKEGTLLTIENFAIPKTSNKEMLTYQFLNFIMKPESVAHTYEQLGFFPATLDVLQHITLQPKVYALLTMPKKDFARFYLVRYDLVKKIISEQELQDIWIRMKG